MASFAQHVNTAVIISGVTIAPLYSSGLININQSLALLCFGIIGGVLPDIDLENSKPIQITSSILSLFIPLLAILTLLESLSILKMLFIWFLSAILLHFFIFKIVLHFTVHRGIIHSIPMAIVMGYTTHIVLEHLLHYEYLFSLLCGIFLFFGFIIHLILDEMISLNAFGMSFKKSLGTALKLYDKKNLAGTFLLYITIFIEYMLYPIHLNELEQILHSFKNINF
ncbi:MAG: hypothetical protein CSA86_00065 [Arcobacter sp.]|nr:MAG: hypothetical protein CSA86_00065 [Arcobacter sp.]